MDLDKPALAALADAIRSSRDTAGITQTELGERAGIGQDKVSRYERGVNEPGVAVLLAIDRACGQPPGTVLRLAGLLERPETAEQVIQSDPGLSPEEARALLTFYRLATSSAAGPQVKRSRSELTEDLRADADKPISRPRRQQPAAPAKPKATKRVG